MGNSVYRSGFSVFGLKVFGHRSAIWVSSLGLRDQMTRRRLQRVNPLLLISKPPAPLIFHTPNILSCITIEIINVRGLGGLRQEGGVKIGMHVHL